MFFFLALTPIILILLLMVRFQWGAARAGGAGYLCALSIAILGYGAGPELLAYAHSKALLLSIDVLLIIWAAFLMYRVVDEAGAIDTIGKALPYLTTDKGMQALIIGWVFASFLQGIGGFGVPVAVIAPILIGLGFSPISAVLIPSIGHGWAVTFGSLGSSFNALMAATGLSSDVLSAPSALFLGISGLFVGGMVAHAAGGWAAVLRLRVPVIILGIVMGVGQYVVATCGLWNVGAFAGGIAGLLVGFPIARRYKGRDNNCGSLNPRELAEAIFPYLVLIAVILSVQVLPSLNELLGRVVVRLEFPQTSTSLGFVNPAGNGREIVIFRHTGMILFYSTVVAYLFYYFMGRYKKGAGVRIISGTVRRVISSSVGIVSMVMMAIVMKNSGMTDALANGLATGVGRAFPMIAPVIGALGAFMTGSNTNSNVVFGALQLRTAEMLGYSAAIILAAQTTGAALTSVMAPTKVVVGVSTAGMAGREGIVIRKLLVYIGILIVLVSVMAGFCVWLFP